MLAHGWTRAVVLGLLCLLLGTWPSPGADETALSDKHKQFLEDVQWLISRAERKAFLHLAHEYQRDGFIRRFWEARDPYPETTVNEFERQWTHRLEEGKQRYKTRYDDRMRMYVLHGDPSDILSTQCQLYLWPLEVWRYDRADNLPRAMTMLFYQRSGGGSFKLWNKQDGYYALRAIPTEEMGQRLREDLGAFQRELRRRCSLDADWVIAALNRALVQQDFGMDRLAETRPKVVDTEWLATLRSYSTDLPAGTQSLTGELVLGFPHAERQKTLVQGLLKAGGATVGGDPKEPTQDLVLNGEVLRDGELFESFRYRYSLPPAGPGEWTSMAFERLLRPASYRLIVRLEDMRSGKMWRTERDMVVPEVEADRTLAAPDARPVASAADLGGAPRIELTSTARDLAIGAIRFEAKVTGGAIDRVVFLLDGQRMLERTRPPFSVEINVGPVPRQRRIRALALGKDGAELASAELDLNVPRQRFTVRLEEPRRNGDEWIVTAIVAIPDGDLLDRVEFQRNGLPLATLFQPPFTTRLKLPPPGRGDTLAAVGFLADGNRAEDARFVGSADYQERIDVHWIEVPVVVEDAAGRPVTGLAESAFRLFDDGQEHRLIRFEEAEDQPLHVLFALDTSASMTASLDAARGAALGFLDRILRPQDRAGVLTFADRASVAAELTNDLETVRRAFATLTAERGTAFYDAVVTAVSYLQGVAGHSALLLYSDGRDRSSRFTFAQSLEFAQRAGVTIYSIGADLPAFDVVARRQLCKLAQETGGRCFFARAENLAEAYATIERDLRHRYLLTYEPGPSANRGFHPLEVKVEEGRRARSLAGYYP
jgi:VWFA-related protein